MCVGLQGPASSSLLLILARFLRIFFAPLLDDDELSLSLSLSISRACQTSLATS